MGGGVKKTVEKARWKHWNVFSVSKHHVRRIVLSSPEETALHYFVILHYVIRITKDVLIIDKSFLQLFTCEEKR